MQDADLFLELAAIAGVFVGFGALIAVRTGGAGDPFEIAMVRGVVSMGLLTIVAALAPVTLGRYDLTEHGIWAVSGVLLMTGMVTTAVANVRTPEYRSTPFPFPRWLAVAGVAAVGLILLATVVGPILIILGPVPELEGAIYFTAVVLILLLDAWWLLQMVFRGRQSAAA